MNTRLLAAVGSLFLAASIVNAQSVITLQDSGEEGRYTIEAAMAKLACTDAAMEMTTWATQFMGGNGFMKEYHVERMMRDAKITQIYEGTNEIQKLIISGSLFR